MPPPLPRHLALLWDIEETARPGRRATLSIHEIGDAAVTIADRDGLAAVTMSAVASTLGRSTMSLYRYVDSRDALLEVMVESMAVNPPADLAEPGVGWRESTRRWAGHFAEGLRRHPWVLDVPVGVDLSPTPRAVAWVDAGLRCLAGAGLSSAETFTALLSLDSVIRGAVRQARTSGVDGRGPSRGAEYAVTAGTLVAEHYPGLAAHAAELADADPEALTTTTLDTAISLVLDGIQARVGPA